MNVPYNYVYYKPPLIWEEKKHIPSSGKDLDKSRNTLDY